MTPDILFRGGEVRTRHSPLLFVHGAFAGAWCWDEQFAPYFQDLGYDCLALDFRGHGDQGGGWFCLQQAGIDDYIADVARAIEQCSAPPIVIAHSMGGFVTLKLCQRQPVELTGLVLMSAGSPHSHLDSAMQMMRDHPLLCYKLNLINSLPKPFWPWIMTRQELRRLMLSDASSIDAPERLWPRLQHESWLAMIQMLHVGSSDPPSINCPILALGGERDIIVPPDFVQRTADWLGSESQILTDMGHSPMLEDDWRIAADHIAEWLERECAGYPC